MLEQDLLDYGYKSKICKIGKLYFKGKFFCILNNNIADFRSIDDDMKSLDKVSSIEELKNAEKNYYIKLKEYYIEYIKFLDNIIENYK